MFLHASILHIGFNMLFLFVFGPEIEYVCGHLRFAALYLLCGIAGGLAQIAIAPGSHVPELGASGAIAGVLGAYIVTYPDRADQHDRADRLLSALPAPTGRRSSSASGRRFSSSTASARSRIALAARPTARRISCTSAGFGCGVLAIGAFSPPRLRERAASALVYLSMRIGIIGAGALGTLFGYRLARDNEVTMLERRPTSSAAMRARRPRRRHGRRTPQRSRSPPRRATSSRRRSCSFSCARPTRCALAAAVRERTRSRRA